MYYEVFPKRERGILKRYCTCNIAFYLVNELHVQSKYFRSFVVKHLSIMLKSLRDLASKKQNNKLISRLKLHVSLFIYKKLICLDFLNEFKI